jgi:hypothetical protein
VKIISTIGVHISIFTINHTHKHSLTHSLICILTATYTSREVSNPAMGMIREEVGHGSQTTSEEKQITRTQAFARQNTNGEQFKKMSTTAQLASLLQDVEMTADASVSDYRSSPLPSPLPNPPTPPRMLEDTDPDEIAPLHDQKISTHTAHNNKPGALAFSNLAAHDSVCASLESPALLPSQPEIGRVHVDVWLCERACMCICECVCMWMCGCVYVYACGCVIVCMYMRIYMKVVVVSHKFMYMQSSFHKHTYECTIIHTLNCKHEYTRTPHRCHEDPPCIASQQHTLPRL